MKTHLLLFSCALTFAACNCGGVSIDEFPDRAAKTYCARVASCCTSTEMADAGSYADEADCVSAEKGSFASQTAGIKAEQGKGRLAWNAATAETCLTKYAALSCEQLKANAAAPAECDSYLEPKVAVGGACALSGSCVGSDCAGASTTSDGTCTARVAQGGDCGVATCVKGSYCENKKCVAMKADGAACANNYECSTGGCNDRPADGGTGVCGLKGGAGTTCFLTRGCSAGAGAPVVLLALAALLRRRRL